MARLCTVITPSGTTTSAAGRRFDFDAAYAEVIAPAVEAAGLEVLRVDEALLGGAVDQPMVERILLSELVVAVLTDDANVAYVFGVRHALRPAGTVLLATDVDHPPFDPALGSAITGAIRGAGAVDLVAGEDAAAELTARLGAPTLEIDSDRLLFRLIAGIDLPEIAHLKAESFAEAVASKGGHNRRIADATTPEELDEIARGLGPLDDLPVGVVLHLFLARREVSDFEAMVAMYQQLSPVIQRLVMVREQYALALGRLGRRREAEEVVAEVLDDAGPSSETYAILGRIHKGAWREALHRGAEAEARGHLAAAADAYKAGFETDWRDTYPGVNALEMLFFLGDRADELAELLPIVTYAIRRKIAAGEPDYWDHATCLELAVLDGDEAAAMARLADVLGAMTTRFAGETTRGTLLDVQAARDTRGESTGLETKLIAALDAKLATLAP